MAEIKEIDLGPVKGPKGDKGDPGERGPEGPVGPQGKDGVVNANTAISFQQASNRQNIASGEKIGTILGKVKKWFADLKAHAFEAPVQNLTTNVTGKVLDAVMGKKLKDEIDTLNSSLAFQHFDDDKELINYANSLLLNEQIGVIVKTFSIGATSVSSFGYSIGFIFKRYSTIAIYVFSYNGNIYSNGKTNSSNWIGWQSH